MLPADSSIVRQLDPLGSSRLLFFRGFRGVAVLSGMPHGVAHLGAGTVRFIEADILKIPNGRGMSQRLLARTEISEIELSNTAYQIGWAVSPPHRHALKLMWKSGYKMTTPATGEHLVRFVRES